VGSETCEPFAECHRAVLKDLRARQPFAFAKRRLSLQFREATIVASVGAEQIREHASPFKKRFEAIQRGRRALKPFAE
jgi:hypothetical protein